MVAALDTEAPEAPTTWVNSADSHVLEPDDIWDQMLPAELASRAPRAERQGEREILYIDGAVVRRDPIAYTEAIRPPGARDPRRRLIDLDNEGIWCELVFPSRGLWVPLITDPVLTAACCTGYNTWLTTEFLPVSERFIGVATLPGLDTDDAVAELGRAVDAGFRVAMLPAAAPPGRSYNDETWEPLWAALAEAGMPICFHAGSGSDPIVNRGPGGAIINYVETFFPVQRTLVQIVAAGVLERHPDLHVVFVEGGASWIPSMMDRMDEAYRQHDMFVHPRLSMPPSELLLRQVSATFQHDLAIRTVIDVAGPAPIMWGSDYPHLEGTFGHTQDALDKAFEGVDPDVRRTVTAENFVKLFGGPAPPAPGAVAA